MTSAENIAWLKSGGRQYLIGTAKGELKRFARELADRRDWRTVREGLEVKVCVGPEGAETFLLVRSADRQQKEEAMHARFREHIETALARLANRIARAQKAIDRSATERQIGRLLGRNSRAAARYRIRLVDDPATPAGLRLAWSVRPEWDEWARACEGCYVLRTNLSDWTSEDLWRTYIQLSEAEAAFRIHKSELALRPIWHQREDRVLAHILVCFLAYVLWKTLEQWQSRAGLGNAPRTILEELGSHPERQRRPAHRDDAATRAAPALRGASRPCPGGAPRPPRTTHPPAPAHAYRRTPNVVPNLDRKSLKTLTRTPETAEVGLTHPTPQNAASPRGPAAPWYAWPRRARCRRRRCRR